MAIEEQEIKEPEAPVVPAEEPGQEAAEEITETPPEEGGEEAPAEGDEPKPERSFSQKELNSILSEDKKGYRKENAHLREENARLKGKEEGRLEVAPEPTPEPTGPPVEPKEADFDGYDEYQAALKGHQGEMVTYLVKQELDQRDEANSTKTAAGKEAERVDTARQNFATKAEEFRAKTPDFDEVVEAAPNVSKTMYETIMNGAMPEVSYHLAKNPEEIGRIGQMSPPEQVVELGRIAGRLEAKKTTSPSGKTITSAPSPPTTVKGRGGGAGKDTYKMDALETFHNEKTRTAKKQAALKGG